MILLEVSLMNPAAEVGMKIGNPQALRSTGSGDQNGAPGLADPPAAAPSSFGSANGMSRVILREKGCT